MLSVGIIYDNSDKVYVRSYDLFISFTSPSNW
mgnify:CR=1 FL=1